MCDDLTETDAARFLARAGTLDRRRFAALGAGAMTLAAMPGCRAQGEPPALPVKGATSPSPRTRRHHRCMVRRPDESGRHPAVLLWPDIAGLRTAYRTMAAHLAASGYAVLAVNQYYRGAKAPVLDPCSLAHAGRTGQAQAPDHSDHTRRHLRDAAYVGWLDRQGEVDTMHRIGTCGFCMGGPIPSALRRPNPTVSALPPRSTAQALSIPDRTAPTSCCPTKAAFLFAIAQNDDARSPDDKTTLKPPPRRPPPRRDRGLPRPARLVHHRRPVYDREQAEKAWSRMLVLFKANQPADGQPFVRTSNASSVRLLTWRRSKIRCR
jgi:carboxymethylenebutenolidase